MFGKLLLAAAFGHVMLLLNTQERAIIGQHYTFRDDYGFTSYLV